MVKLDNRGITLIEILLATVILGVVMIIAYGMLFQTYDIVDSSSERVANNRMIEIAFEDISNYIRSLESYDEDYEGEQNNIDYFLIESYISEVEKSTEILITYNGNNNTLKLFNNEKDEAIKIIKNITDFDLKKVGNSNSFNLKLVFSDGVEFKKFKTITARNM